MKFSQIYKVYWKYSFILISDLHEIEISYVKPFEWPKRKNKGKKFKLKYLNVI